LPGTTGRLVYFHFAQHRTLETVKNSPLGMHGVLAKGATRAFPAGILSRAYAFSRRRPSDFASGQSTGGKQRHGRSAGAAKSAYSVNHGAGRPEGAQGGGSAIRSEEDCESFTAHDILTNCGSTRRIERRRAYKDFEESSERGTSDLGQEVARLKSAFCDQGHGQGG